jgi:hypothetical protein
VRADVFGKKKDIRRLTFKWDRTTGSLPQKDMKQSILLLAIIAAATSAAYAAAWNLNYNVAPETGCLTNGVVRWCGG